MVYSLKTLITVCTFYEFARMHDVQSLRDRAWRYLNQLKIKGTLLIAEEGVNSTLCGDEKAIDEVLAWLRRIPGLEAMGDKRSYAEQPPFKRLKVKIRKEIVSFGHTIDPDRRGAYLDAEEWNQLIQQEDVVLVDTRNDYEYMVGTFEGAINPKTETFRELPQWVHDNLDPKKHKRVAMFCTGGIRCEKSTAWMIEQGFEEVYHLNGGILQYLEDMPQEQSLWRGNCFVFDDRVAVNHDLESVDGVICFGCRRPLTENDMQSDDYEESVSCPHCIGTLNEARAAAFRERKKQLRLAKERGTLHRGQDFSAKAHS